MSDEEGDSDVESSTPSALTRDQAIELLTHHQADPGLRSDLDALAGETTDHPGNP